MGYSETIYSINQTGDLKQQEAEAIVKRFPDAVCVVCERKSEVACCECRVRQRAVELVQSVRFETLAAETRHLQPPLTDFDRFWIAYPKKEKKQEARKAWKKLDPSPELAETILREVRLRAQSWDWRKDKHAFVPMASAYLNGRRWEDEWEDREPAGRAPMGANAPYQQTKLSEADFAAMFVNLDGEGDERNG